MASNRKKEDEFNQSTKRKLRDRVAHRCSNPSCRVPTSAPGDNKEGLNNTGIGAHIHAASPGGARYLAVMTPEQRSSFENGIWLCDTCSRKIDNSPSDFSAGLLRDWKQQAEDKAKEEQGQRLPDKDDAPKMLMTAMTGQPTGILNSAIRNTHQGISKSYENLDPRFKVESSYMNGVENYEISAKEDGVEVKLQINTSHMPSFMDMQKRMIERGEELVIPTENISADSPLFQNIFEQKGELKVQVRKISAIQKMWLECPDTHVIDSFDDISGNIAIGLKAINFEGSSFKDVFKIKYSKEAGEEKKSSQFTATMDFEKWEGLNVNRIPYFNKIQRLYDRMCRGWLLHTSLEIEGDELLKNEPIDLSEEEFIRDIGGFLWYCKNVRNISLILDKDIKFTTETGYTSEEFRRVEDVSNLLTKNRILYAKDIKENMTFEITLDDDEEAKDTLLKGVSKNHKETYLKLEKESEQIFLFGQELDLPPHRIILSNTRLKVNKELKDIKAGEIIKVECIPENNFKFEELYVLDQQ